MAYMYHMPGRGGVQDWRVSRRLNATMNDVGDIGLGLMSVS